MICICVSVTNSETQLKMLLVVVMTLVSAKKIFTGSEETRVCWAEKRQSYQA